MRSMAGDAATNAAGKLQPSEDQIGQIDQPADDDTWHDVPEVSRAKLKGQLKGYSPFGKKEVKEAAAEGAAPAHPEGSTDPADTAALAVQDQQAGTDSGVDPVSGAQVAASSLKDKADTNGQVSKTKGKVSEYNQRTQTYLKGKMPK